MTPPDNNPEIPSFKKDQDKEKKGGGAPLLGRGATGAKPILKIRGLSAGTTLVERLKQFKKKDIAFILSGLGVLFMAPLAEHFILGPSDESKILNRGFDSKGNVFSEANPYEPGTGGFSPGGLPGQGTDVITPLNVRDPSALVMGPGANQTPPTPAPPKEEKKDNNSWKDALEASARAGARGAAASAGLPTPKGALSGALRGLSALGGGGGGGGPSFSLPPVSANNVPNKAAGGHNMLNVAGAPGYKGVANRGISSGGNDDALKKAGENAAGLFNRAGSAANNLDQAAKETIPGGGRADSQGNGPGGGAGSKDPGGNQNKDNKSMGESLAFLRAKMIMEKQLDLDFKKKEWREFEMYKMIQQKIVEQTITDILGKGFTQPAGYMISNYIMGKLGGTLGYMCTPIDAQGHPTGAPTVWVQGSLCPNPQQNTVQNMPQGCTPLVDTIHYSCTAVDGQGNTTPAKGPTNPGGTNDHQAANGYEVLNRLGSRIRSGALKPDQFCKGTNQAICQTPGFTDFLNKVDKVGQAVYTDAEPYPPNSAAQLWGQIVTSNGNAGSQMNGALTQYIDADLRMIDVLDILGPTQGNSDTIYAYLQTYQDNSKSPSEKSDALRKATDKYNSIISGSNGGEGIVQRVRDKLGIGDGDAGRAKAFLDGAVANKTRADGLIAQYRLDIVPPPSLSGDAADAARSLSVNAKDGIDLIAAKLTLAGQATTDRSNFLTSQVLNGLGDNAGNSSISRDSWNSLNQWLTTTGNPNNLTSGGSTVDLSQWSTAMTGKRAEIMGNKQSQTAAQPVAQGFGGAANGAPGTQAAQ